MVVEEPQQEEEHRVGEREGNRGGYGDQYDDYGNVRQLLPNIETIAEMTSLPSEYQDEDVAQNYKQKAAIYQQKKAVLTCY